MKKRLLSAALAFAIVLTLIPATVVPAFAAYQTPGSTAPNAMGSGGIVTTTDANGKEKKIVFYEVDATHNTTQTVTRCTTPGDGTGREFGKWYWLDNKTDPQNPQYMEVTSGIIAGNNGSGGWYPDQTAFVKTDANGKQSLRSTSLTLLGATTLDMSSGVWTSTSVNVDIEGTGTLTLGDYTTSATVTSKFVTGTPTGNVAGLTRDHDAYVPAAPGSNALRLDATNVNVAAIDFDGRGNQVTLNNCVMAGGVDMDGTTATSATATGYTGQQFNATNCKIVGNISVLGDGSRVNLTSVTGNGGAAGDVTIQGHGGSLTIAGASNVGNVVAKSRAAGVNDTTISSIPTVAVSGGIVASINTTTDAGNGSAKIDLTRQTGNTSVGAVQVNKGAVTVASGVTTAAITVPEGSVSIAGSTNTNAAIGTGATTATVTLGANGKTTLSVSGYGSDIQGITVPAGKGTNLTISGWPAGRNNDFGTVDLDSFASKKIAGGLFDLSGGNLPFSTDEAYGWVDTTNLTYQAKLPSGKAALYSVNDLGQAIDDVNGNNTALVTDGPAADAGNIVPIGNTTTNTLTLMYGTGTLAKIQFSALTPIVLPSRLNSKNITSWMQLDNGGNVVKSYTSGKTYTVPAADITLNATDVAEDVSKITGIKNAGTTTAVDGNNIRAELRGNTIYLSGAVKGGLNDMTGLALDLTTDVIDTSGQPVVLDQVPVDFNTKTKAAQFNEFWGGQNGAYTKDGKLYLSNGAVYDVNGSGLSVSAPNLKLAGENANGYEIQVTVGGKLASWRPEAKEKLINLLNGGTAGFSIGTGANANRAMLEAINAAQATITNTTSVENWVNNARSTIWTRGFKSADTTKNTQGGFYPNMTTHGGTYANAASTDADKTAITNAFAAAYIVPYLQVNVTDYDESGTLTATLTPSYRVDVSAEAGYDYTNGLVYTVQTGRALSALTGDMSNPVTVKFNLGAPFATQKMHQDGKYVYTETAGAWKINHAGTNGLGTIEINSVAGLIELKNPKVDGTLGDAMEYDSLQAAVDDTVPEVKKADDTFAYSQITIKSSFGGSTTFAMTGLARTIKVQSLGNKDLTCTSSYVDKTGTNGIDFTFQLRRDNVVVGNVAINVAEGSTGTVTLSASKAREGDTIIVTVQPAQGNSVTGVTAKTNTGAGVTVTASPTTANQYTFVVPKGATSVTVTPTFKQGTAQATVSVSTSTQGTATTTAAATNNKVNAGSNVGVTTSPGVGYRTMGVNITTNGGAASASRMGDNYFTFTVPSNATAVTVTPVYDRDNGTKFTDVWSTEYYSKSVAWAVSKGVTDGQSTYLFGSNNYCTRAQMVTFLWRAAGRPSVTGIANPFVDVSPTLTPGDYYSAILWAVSKGITDGTDRTHFSPSKTVSRAEAVTFLYRYEKSPAASASNAFYDVPASQWYAKAVTWAANKGITKGRTNTTFDPNAACKRCEIVTFLYRDVTGDIT